MRLSLTLPRAAVGEALARINQVAPEAEFRQLVEVPEDASCAWQDLTRPAIAKTALSIEEPLALTLRGVLCEENVLLDLDAPDVSTLFQQLAIVASQRYGVDARSVVDGLVSREALGSTGLGQGVAIPHARLCGIPRAIAIYVRPAVPLPFNAPDNLPVGDVLCLLIPDWAQNTYLHLLASAAQFFCDRRFRHLLRSCKDPGSVCRLFATYVFEQNNLLCGLPDSLDNKAGRT